MATHGVQHSQGTHTHSEGYVLVTVKHAANLKDTELLGKQEPYVRLQLGGEKVETDTERGVNPVFNEQVKLPLPSSYFARTSGATNELLVSVYNEKTLLPDRLIGHGRVSLSSADEGSKTVPLYDKRGNPAGHVVLQLSVHDGSTHIDKTGVESTTASLAATHITEPTATEKDIPFHPVTGRVVSAHEYATITDHPVTREVREQYAVTTPVLHEAVAKTRHVGDVALTPSAEVVSQRQELVSQHATPATAIPAPQHFSEVEDRTKMKQQVQTIKEVTPVEHLYETTTREKDTRTLPPTAHVVGQHEETIDQRTTGPPVLPQPQQFSTVECRDTLKERRERVAETQGVERTFEKATVHTGDVPLATSEEVVHQQTRVREA